MPDASGNPTNQILHRRRIGSVPYNGGGRQVLDIDRAGVLVALRLHLKFTNTNGATAPTIPLFQQAARVAKRIELVANGRDTPVNVSGHYYSVRQQYEFDGTVPFGMETAIGVGNNAVSNVELVQELRFDAVDGRRADDFGIDSRGMSQLQLALSWGTNADLWGTNPAFATLSNQSCTVEGEFLMNPSPQSAYLVRQMDEVQRPVNGSATDYDIIIDRGSGVVYRSFLMFTTTGDVADDSLILTNNGNRKLVAGSYTYFNREAVLCRAEMRNTLRIPSANIIAGTYYDDLCFDGQNTSGIDTTGLSADLRLLSDVTYTAGNSMLTVQREAFRQPRWR
jgi:hypothetical protein